MMMMNIRRVYKVGRPDAPTAMIHDRPIRVFTGLSVA